MTARSRANWFLAIWLPVLAIDGFPSCTAIHTAVETKVNYALVKTGLWQGPWRLFGPEVDRQNLRLSAQIAFADEAVITWQSPDWTQVSAFEKFYRQRRTNYFGNILKADMEPAWAGLCAYLARSVPHPSGKPVAVASVTLILRGAVIPDPGEPMIPAAPYLAFDEPAPIYTWKP